MARPIPSSNANVLRGNAHDGQNGENVGDPKGENAGNTNGENVDDQMYTGRTAMKRLAFGRYVFTLSHMRTLK